MLSDDPFMNFTGELITFFFPLTFSVLIFENLLHLNTLIF